MLGWILLLVVVVLVNIGMIMTAFLTNPGLVKDDYYEQGRDYERTVLQLIEARKRLGWQVSLESGVVKVGAPSQLQITVMDRDGKEVTGLSGNLQVYRPSDRQQDMIVSLLETEPGIYRAYYTVMLKGVWDLQVTLKHEEDTYTAEQRVHAEAS